MINPLSIAANSQDGKHQIQIHPNPSETECHDCPHTRQKLNVCGHHTMQCCMLIAAWNSWDGVPIHVCRVLFMTRLLIRDCQTWTSVTEAAKAQTKICIEGFSVFMIGIGKSKMFCLVNETMGMNHLVQACPILDQSAPCKSLACTTAQCSRGSACQCTVTCTCGDSGIWISV